MEPSPMTMQPQPSSMTMEPSPLTMTTSLVAGKYTLYQAKHPVKAYAGHDPSNKEYYLRILPDGVAEGREFTLTPIGNNEYNIQTYDGRYLGIQTPSWPGKVWVCMQKSVPVVRWKIVPGGKGANDWIIQCSEASYGSWTVSEPNNKTSAIIASKDSSNLQHWQITPVTLPSPSPLSFSN